MFLKFCMKLESQRGNFWPIWPTDKNSCLLMCFLLNSLVTKWCFTSRRNSRAVYTLCSISLISQSLSPFNINKPTWTKSMASYIPSAVQILANSNPYKLAALHKGLNWFGHMVFAELSVQQLARCVPKTVWDSCPGTSSPIIRELTCASSSFNVWAKYWSFCCRASSLSCRYV